MIFGKKCGHFPSYPILIFYSGFGRLVEGSDGSIFYRVAVHRATTPCLPFRRGGFRPNGKIRVATDTPSSSWVETETSADGKFVYTMKNGITDHAAIDKYNVSNGTFVRARFGPALKKPSQFNQLPPNLCGWHRTDCRRRIVGEAFLGQRINWWRR